MGDFAARLKSCPDTKLCLGYIDLDFGLAFLWNFPRSLQLFPVLLGLVGVNHAKSRQSLRKSVA